MGDWQTTFYITNCSDKVLQQVRHAVMMYMRQAGEAHMIDLSWEESPESPSAFILHAHWFQVENVETVLFRIQQDIENLIVRMISHPPFPRLKSVWAWLRENPYK